MLFYNVNLCECWCGNEVGFYTRTSSRSNALKGQPMHYIPGHSNRGKKRIFSKEWCENLSKANKGKNSGEKHPFYGKHLSEKHKQNMSNALKGKNAGENNYNYGKHLSEEHKQKLKQTHLGKKVSDETKQKMSLSRKGKPKSEEHKLKIGIGNRNKIMSEEAKIKIGISSKERWRDPAYIENQRETHKKLWKNPEFVANQMKIHSVKQNKAEIFLESILNNLFPNEYKFVGDGQLIILGKCPDFININGQKKIIELWGEHWHQGQNPQDRIDIFTPYGYQTLIILGKELRNIKILKEKLINFHTIGY